LSQARFALVHPAILVKLGLTFNKGTVMQKSLFLITAFALSPAVLAQPAAPDPADLMARMDSNADGYIGKDEAKGRLAENFDVIDADKDGKLSLDELKARMAAQRGGEDRPRPAAGGMPSPEQIIGFLDANQDGFVARDEAQGPLAQHFDFVDADKDAKISLDELKTAMAAMQPPAPDGNTE
jgi:Ca2+-binding EF-hand superfamily protein